MPARRRAPCLTIQYKYNKLLYKANCCNIFQFLYTADLNSALYLYSGIGNIPEDFVCKLLIITVSFKIKNPFSYFLN
jgi:hypothetical protein